MKEGLWKSIDFFKSIANKVESSLYGETWLSSESYLEKKKLELLITSWVLKHFNIDMSDYELPCTTRRPINGGPCERFGDSADISLIEVFENFNFRFVIEAYKILGWDFNIKIINTELFNCFDIDESRNVIVDEKMLAEYLGCDVYDYFGNEIDTMCQYSASGDLHITHFIVQKNKRLGKFLTYASINPCVCESNIYKDIVSYVGILQEPLLLEYDEYIQHHAILSDGSFGICYYFLYSDSENEDITPLSYQVTNLIYACILNLLLDRAAEEFNFEN